MHPRAVQSRNDARDAPGTPAGRIPGNPACRIAAEDSSQPARRDTHDSSTRAQRQQQSADQERIFAPGAILADAYRVGELLGTGGMSQVFEARDLRLYRTLAIKACRTDVPGSPIRKEGRLLGSFRDPGIVAIHDTGTHAGIDYLVLERLHGSTLRCLLEQAKSGLPLSRALDILIALCDTVAVLHRADVIHRDLKPANIMITPGDHPILFDLGVALRQEQWADGHGMAGSPGYMAPESIVEDETASTGYLVDIYSLGCIAFELLTGHVPFRGSESDLILTQHIQQQAPRVSSMVEVPEPLDWLIAEMLLKSPAQRPQSAAAVGAWLRGVRQSLNEVRDAPSLEVLIANNDREMRAVLGSYVKHCAPDATVRFAADGVSALREIRCTQPDILLLDMDIPEMSGIELCMLIRGTPLGNHMTIAALGGASRDQDRALAEGLGIVEFIRDGENIGELLHDLQRLLDESAKKRALAESSAPAPL